MVCVSPKFRIVIGLVLCMAIMPLKQVLANDGWKHHYYIGTETGISTPVVKIFKDAENDSVFRLDGSTMLGLRAGYSFFPGMMVELSATRQPSYGFKYDLRSTLKGSTKIETDVFMLNVIYELPEKYYGLKPYFITGAGVAKVKIKASEPSTLEGLTIFQVEKNNINCFTYQIGGGVAKDITDNLSIDFGLKLQIINDINFKFQFLTEHGSVKKSPGAAEIALGLIYKI